jgi:hypothetical protein
MGTDNGRFLTSLYIYLQKGFIDRLLFDKTFFLPLLRNGESDFWFEIQYHN